jgi:FOG: WD40-like repeat
MVVVLSAFLMTSIATSLILVPSTSAHTPAWNIPTYAYITAGTNPIGVGQPVNIIMWLDTVIGGAYPTNDIRFHNYNLTITKPDGTTETHIFDVIQDTTSSQSYSFTPTTVGNYTLTFTFPGQTYTWTSNDYTNDTYSPSSASTTLTVQEEQITTIDSYPLPTEYWTRPIYGENTYWYSISSNWLGTSSPQLTASNGFNLYVSDGVGSQTSHIMWTKPLQSGGVVGGTDVAITGDTYFDGTAYSMRYINPIIMDGKLYYTEPVSTFGVNGGFGDNSGPTDCVDLRTGELLWSRTDVPALSFGYIYDMQSINYHGVQPPVLVAVSGTTWQGYDADTGNWIFNVTNVPSGTKAMGPSGEYLIYVLSNKGTAQNPQYYLAQWNSTNVAPKDYSSLATGAISGTLDGSASSCYDWNISIPSLNTMTSTPSIITAYSGDIMLCLEGSLPAGYAALTFASPSQTPYTYFAINLNASKGTVGSVLWTNTLNPPAGNITVTQGGVDPESRVFLEGYNELRQWVGYNLDTGAKLWGPTASQAALDYYGTPGNQAVSCQIAYGKAYSSEFSGIIYCYDVKTGDLLWTYGNGGEGNSTNSGLYTGEGNYPTAITAIGNGIIYTISTEHTVTTPIYKGALARAINATDGTEIWTLSDYTSEFVYQCYAMADGYNTWFNGYDNQIYTVGKGPSQTTLTAPNAGLTPGQSVVLSGLVTDISTGSSQNAVAKNFPSGLPVASDASMKDWMGYVYQQKPLPTNFTGVSVTINIVDSNGNYRTIGSTTTDAKGQYSFSWIPDITGNYKVYAIFEGTNGYWSSSAEASFTVDQAAAATTPQATAAPSAADLYFLPAVAGIIIAIIIGFAVLALLVTKKP